MVNDNGFGHIAQGVFKDVFRENMPHLLI